MLKTSLLAGVLLLAVSFCPPTVSAQTEGTATFKVTTVAAGQNFDPRHVLAIWVEKPDGTFVKTLLRRAERRVQYLRTWVGVSGQDATDAVTGATLSSHREHTLTWDCRDTSGTIVPDEEYDIRVEFTAAHEQGPITPRGHMRFAKGPDEVSLSPGNLTNFRNMSLTYGPDLETNTLVAAGSTWKYHDKGLDLHDTDWKLADYDDSAWDEGPGKLGYEDGAVTVLSFGADDDKHPCYYFRHEFTVDLIPISAKFRVLRDDGVVVYLNGVEVIRDNMDPGPTAHGDLASGTVGGGDEDMYFQFQVSPGMLRPGENILAAEVHQATADSSDLGFDLELKVGPSAEAPVFKRGDVDANGELQITDAVALLNFLFLGAEKP
jgi:hypothetical protein